MNCPECAGDTKVIDSRGATRNRTRRRHRCLRCTLRFTTYEIVETEMDRLDVLNSQVSDLMRTATRISELAASLAWGKIKPDREVVSAALRAARVRAGLKSTYEAAHHLRIEPSSYRRGEKFGRCRRVTLVQIASAYGLTLDSLLDLGRRQLAETLKGGAE